MSFAFEKIPRISLGCKLVPVYYREYEYGLLAAPHSSSVGQNYLSYAQRKLW